jgi:hypothetical protein
VAHGFCSRHPATGACPYANICEQCDNFVPDPDRRDPITAQLADVIELRDDATERGWDQEATRPQRVADSLAIHIRHIDRTPTSDASA